MNIARKVQTASRVVTKIVVTATLLASLTKRRLKNTDEATFALASPRVRKDKGKFQVEIENAKLERGNGVYHTFILSF